MNDTDKFLFSIEPVVQTAEEARDIARKALARTEELATREPVNGRDGKDGRDGVDGAPGQKGLDGAPGSKGDKGDDGKDGRDGVDGADGLLGAPGAPGEKGDKGDPGDKGDDGAIGAEGPQGPQGPVGGDGIGINAQKYEPGAVYLEGTVVQHHFGQFFAAAKNTYAEPGESTDWERVGTLGLRHTGGFKEGRQYQVGDIYVKDYAGFQVMPDGTTKMLWPAPRVDKLIEAIKFGADLKGAGRTKYGNVIEVDMSGAVPPIVEAIAKEVDAQITKIAAEMVAKQDASVFAVTKQLAAQEDEVYRNVSVLRIQSKKYF